MIVRFGIDNHYLDTTPLEGVPCPRCGASPLQVEQMAVSLDADGDGTADVVPQLRYFGNSLGGIMGSNFVSFSKHVSSSVLNVPGAGLSNLVISPNLSDTLGWLLYAQTAIEVGTPEFFLAFSLVKASGQPFFDPGDPINVIGHTRADMAVLQAAAAYEATLPWPAGA